MKKDYKNWHKNKLEINNKKERVFFHDKEIWFCHLGENIGFEQDGIGENFLRPVVIIRKFNNEVFIGSPLTKANKKGPYYFQFEFKKPVKSNAIISQLRLVDSKRLKYKIGVMKDRDFLKLKEKIRLLFT